MPLRRWASSGCSRLGAVHPRFVSRQPAANAGIQPGDVLVEFAGKKIDGLDAFRAMVAARKPGQRVAIKLRRRGQELFVDVTLGQPPERVRPRPDDAQPFRIQPFAVPKPAAKTKLPIGVTVQPLTPMLAAQFHYGGDKGLLVTAVEPDSAAGNGRPVPVQRGDLLKEIARKPVATVAEATAALAEARRKKAKKIIVLVRNAEGARYLVIDLPH